MNVIEHKFIETVQNVTEETV